ncbi:MAG TPA: SLBB domain-containing protein [Thiolinea sp.]|nr:SLBB domain-containing protein [Thiolinea sp.]
MKRSGLFFTFVLSALLLSACSNPYKKYEPPPLPRTSTTEVRHMPVPVSGSVSPLTSALGPAEPVATRMVPAPRIVNAFPLQGQLAGSDVIAVNDLLEINIFKVPDLSRSLRVDNRGFITFPLIGPVRAQGLSPSQLEKTLAQKLGATYMNNPQVSVLVKESTQNRVTVEGAVKKPGMFPVSGTVTVLQAIALAEGVTDKADLHSAVLLRRDPRGQVVQLPIDLAAIRTGRMQDPLLLQDDRVVVAERSVLNRFTVGGAVSNAGVFDLTDGMTFLQAISSAGGISRLADKKQAYLFRRSSGGGIQRYRVNYQAILEGRAEDPLLQADDRIMVMDSRGRQLFEDATRVISPMRVF